MRTSSHDLVSRVRPSHRRFSGLVLISTMLLTAVVATGCPRPVSYFEVGFPTLEDGRFVIALSDPATIAAARRAIEDPEGNPSSVMGIIIKKPAEYNEGWSYHLDPATIELFEIAAEVCDASPQYVEEILAEVCGSALPDCRWCPWTSQVVAEIE